jgi:hypothetical protein
MTNESLSVIRKCITTYLYYVHIWALGSILWNLFPAILFHATWGYSSLCSTLMTVMKQRFIHQLSNSYCSVKGPLHGQTVCQTQAVAQTIWSCVVWFDCLCDSLTIFKQVWILLLNNQVVQQFEARMDMFASCCTTSPVHHWFSYRSRLPSKRHARLQMMAGVCTVISVATGIMEWKVMCIKTAIWRMPASFDMFSLWHLPEDWSLCGLIMSHMDTVSCCTTLLCKFVWPYMEPLRLTTFHAACMDILHV